MDRLFVFDFDDTLAGFSVYNSWVLKQPIRVLPPLGGTYRGVPELLDLIVSGGDDLSMLTMNLILNERAKWEKLERVGMRRWFHEGNVRMVKQKTPEVMKEVCSGRDLTECYMVGNSLKHDILPALEAGLNAIYIPRPLIKRLLPSILPDSDRLYVLGDIGQMTDLYRRL